MYEIIKIIISFGLFGDYNVIRKLTKRHKIFFPLYKLYEHNHAAFLPIDCEIKGIINFPHGPIGCFSQNGVLLERIV